MGVLKPSLHREPINSLIRALSKSELLKIFMQQMHMRLKSSWTLLHDCIRCVFHSMLNVHLAHLFFTYVRDSGLSVHIHVSSVFLALRYIPTRSWDRGIRWWVMCVVVVKTIFFSVLSEGSLTYLVEILRNTQVPSNWKYFGVILKFQLGALNTIANTPPHTPQNCLMEVLNLWLNRMDPPPSWKALVEALNILGEERLALEIKQKYCR